MDWGGPVKLQRKRCCGSSGICEGGPAAECGCELYPRIVAAGAELCEETSLGKWIAEGRPRGVIGAQKDVDASHQQPLNRPPPLLVARRSTKRHIGEFVVQYERNKIPRGRGREGRDNEAVSINDLVDDDAVIDAVCSHAFCRRS